MIDDDATTKLTCKTYWNTSAVTIKKSTYTVVIMNNIYKPDDVYRSIALMPKVPAFYGWGNNNGKVVAYGTEWALESQSSTKYIMRVHYWNTHSADLSAAIQDLTCYFLYMANNPL